MELSAKDATILSLISARPRTNQFDKLLSRADSAETRELARKIREAAVENDDDDDEDEGAED